MGQSNPRRIVNISSMTAIEDYAGPDLCNASKAALSAPGDAFDQQIVETGVRATAVESGAHSDTFPPHLVQST